MYESIMIFKLKYMDVSMIIVFQCFIFVLLISIIVCQQSHPIPEHHNNQPFKENSAECVGDPHAGNYDCVNLEFPKKHELLYKDPQKVLGKSFNNTITKSLCSSHLTVMGSSLVSNHFTRQGIDMCTKVCKTQLDKILKVYPTTVVLKDMYCSRSGIRMASCICEFKISCQVNIHSVLIHFIVNRDGYLAVFDEEVGKPYLF
ncbi:hypothetical protein AGLY_012109 [Aphis glycines]|uniref:Uncharacterized protein n=1 Tax=Aphis glycines TaxID=307491 RepID=A0A6G0TBA4_APHGL|nr:hypothetical protein AGLY_012109 [Aphis glycines]